MKNYFLIIVAVIFSTSNSNSQQLAFPSAEGYGKYTTGGRGGKVIEVTNLESSGPGSFLSAVEEKGARTIVFRVSGTIEANITVANDSITIAGQTAPGDGITLKGMLKINASNVIIRYIRIRAEAKDDAIGGRYQKNIIIDHVSASWSKDEVMTFYHGENITIQWCMITEACSDTHKFGGIWGNNYGTYHHNLFAHNISRNPRFASSCGYNDFRNNVIYNWQHQSVYGGEKHQTDRGFQFSTINMIANYYKSGPGTHEKVRSRILDPSTRNGKEDAGKWWVSENFVVGFPDVTANNWKGVTKQDDHFKLSEPWLSMDINQETAEEAYKSVLNSAGCSLPKRDIIDQRIIEEVRTGTATKGKNGFVANPQEAGGWPVLKNKPAHKDTDHDGMPDYWEEENKLDKNNSEDRNIVTLKGYTMLETYINGIK
ncbi:hypothetical protein QLS71_017365 [Mariniflexile litorale]|uniref:Pectate lyase n=1 Tax=Mariniflexile litorale TaxID=3045158 RepID=A0AAU7EEL4_9FLAO|nr:hypothetical protein [Mariniflexile sp. KMM 9835]MDQ8211616.1 hypothetical protein [Mariniflexile sp. KMM 9835]